MRDEPEDDAYSRLTDPDRYRGLVPHVRTVIDRLVADFDCRVVEPTYDDLPHRLVPGDGEWTFEVRPVSLDAARLVFRIRSRDDSPVDPDPQRRLVQHAVAVVAGRWHEDGFPRCGCDACDEDVDELRELMDELVDGVVTGPFWEEWDGNELSYGLPTGRGGRWSRGFADEFAGVDPVRHDWAPWPRR